MGERRPAGAVNRTTRERLEHTGGPVQHVRANIRRIFIWQYLTLGLDSGGQLADVTGQQVLNPETYEEVTDEVGRLSDGTLERVEDETP
jgi:hypothetical protein